MFKWIDKDKELKNGFKTLFVNLTSPKETRS